MEKWVCKRCGREVFEKPKKNAICNKDGCKGRYQHYVNVKTVAKNLRYINLGLPKQMLQAIIVVGNAIVKHKLLTKNEYIQDLQRQSEIILVKNNFVQFVELQRKFIYTTLCRIG